MADSERPRDRDDAVPGQEPDPEVPAPAPQGGEVRRCVHEEADPGSALRRRRARMVGECLFWLVRLLLETHSNGG
ncbi:hypothetical protein [Streptomyces sp. NPDC007172]|uniref:hypothetical protein n=1 Tax=Streptomyces sp. NPDC007172 TaxID=3364776 RepID=UPI003694F320